MSRNELDAVRMENEILKKRISALEAMFHAMEICIEDIEEDKNKVNKGVKKNLIKKKKKSCQVSMNLLLVTWLSTVETQSTKPRTLLVRCCL